NLNAELKPSKTEEGSEKSEKAERPKPQPVARPAPMAPRAQPGPKQQARTGGPLADRLKAQRQAAEKLAEQRILAARSAANEQKPADKPKFTFAEEELAQARREVPAEPKRDQQPAFTTRLLTTGAPKNPQASGPAVPPPLVPPRPALGGERPIVPQSAETRVPPPQGLGRPARQPSSQPSGYRPLDPPAHQARQPAPT